MHPFDSGLSRLVLLNRDVEGERLRVRSGMAAEISDAFDLAHSSVPIAGPGGVVGLRALVVMAFR